MNLPPEHQKDFMAMPAALRQLLEAELAAGNAIVEVAHCFPAPPAGAYFKLANPVSTRPRESSDGILFCERNHSSYFGEFTDAKRFFFILEPPLPPPTEPDMEAIRAKADFATLPGPPKFQSANAPTPVVERFRASMVIDYGKWHDGIGYDLRAIAQATPEERTQIESLLLSRSVDDWRDVEALAALNSPKTRAALRRASQSKDHRVAAAVVEHAPDLVSDEQRIATLVSALEDAEISGGLSQALDQIAGFHPLQIVDALFRGLLKRDGTTAVHFAAMLMFIHGKAKTSFDWDQRSFLLRFNTEDAVERAAACRELHAKIGVSQ